MKSFASDNYSPVLPEIFSYLAKVVNLDHARAYGNDDFTKQSAEVIKKHLNLPTAEVHFVMTGTAANVLSVKQTLRSTQSLLVTNCSHLTTNETGAPEAFTQSKILNVNSIGGKIDLVDAQRIIDQEADIIPHTPRPKMVSIAQATEYGTVYTLEELRAVSAFCKKNNLYLHLDLCRVYNAALFLQVEIAEIIQAASPDIFSLGGTKNGLLMAEAVVVIADELKIDFDLLQKQSMQLYSKMRYISAQFIPFFENELWKKAAEQANETCSYLEQSLRQFDEITLTMPVETNQLFAVIPKKIVTQLQNLFPFYVWNTQTGEVRFVTSFDTTKEEVDELCSKIEEFLKN